MRIEFSLAEFRSSYLVDDDDDDELTAEQTIDIIFLTLVTKRKSKKIIIVPRTGWSARRKSWIYNARYKIHLHHVKACRATWRLAHSFLRLISLPALPRRTIPTG